MKNKEVNTAWCTNEFKSLDKRMDFHHFQNSLDQIRRVHKDRVGIEMVNVPELDWFKEHIYDEGFASKFIKEARENPDMLHFSNVINFHSDQIAIAALAKAKNEE